MGDNSIHKVTLDLINSTVSMTGGRNTKNHGTNMSTEPHKRAVEGTSKTRCNKTTAENLD